VLDALALHDYGHRELVVRCNGLDTPWGLDDLQAFANAPIAALLFPKIETTAQIDAIAAALVALDSALALWIMIETPTAVLDLRDLAEDERVACLVMGTSDLVKELRASHTPKRENLGYALQRCVMVARHAGKEIFDGVHLDFRNLESFREVCEAARAMGFDGKTLIHPQQIVIANEVFGYGSDAVVHAQEVLAAWESALAAGKGVAELNGQLIENLHAEEARRVVAFAAALRQRSGT